MGLLRFFVRWARRAAVLYLIAFAALWFGRGALIYPFDPTQISPTQAGEPRLSVKTLTTQDGETLVVWARKARGNKPTFFYFHGNAGNLASRTQRFDRLIDRGYGIIALGYRGSSGSTGRPSETAISQDALALYAARHKVLGGAIKGKIIFYGESLGTGVATKLATTHPPDALILEAPYTSVVDMAVRQAPIFPIRAVLDHRWETNKHITSVTVPTLILHGTKDRVIPFSMGQKIYALSAAKTKQFKQIIGGSHLSGFSVEGQKAIYSFIAGL